MQLPHDELTNLETDVRIYRQLKKQLAASRIPQCADLCENNERIEDCQFGERFLQIFWNEQRFRQGLVTADGRGITVISPGTWNVEPGPDFRNAAVKIGDEFCYGDVEVHRTPADWFRHGHGADPAYNRVVLHVVWRCGDGGAESAGPLLPCFELGRHLEQPWYDLARELQAAVYPYARQVGVGACALRLAASDDQVLRRLLTTAGTTRFVEKSERLYRKGIVLGFEQAVHEEFFAALGYKSNQEPMRRLAAAVTVADLATLSGRAGREAALLGVAGLLPDPSHEDVRPEWRPHLAGWWEAWWRQGREVAEVAWALAPLRPANRPERRILAGLVWLEKTDFSPGRWCLERVRQSGNEHDLLRRLWEELLVDGEWGGRSARGLSAAPDLGDGDLPVATGHHPSQAHARLLGRSRAGDILANVLLPFAYSASRHHGDVDSAAKAMRTFLALPKLQSNRRLTEAVHRLLVPPSRQKDVITRAVEQQGLLELYRDFCGGSWGDCRNCPLCAAGE